MPADWLGALVGGWMDRAGSRMVPFPSALVGTFLWDSSINILRF